MPFVARPFVFLAFLAACGSPEPDTSRLAAMDQISLWQRYAFTQSPLERAYVETELALRGVTHNEYQYLGQKTSVAFGRPLYSRQLATSGEKDCADFPSEAAAQRFFLNNGGPISDSFGLDRDGDGLACEWGTKIKKIAQTYGSQRTAYSRTATRSYNSTCFRGPRGGTYTITASGNKNYSGC